MNAAHRATADQLLSIECITHGHPLPELAEAIARALGEERDKALEEAARVCDKRAEHVGICYASDTEREAEDCADAIRALLEVRDAG
jgi:LmbE family N-acetylglucosaminyl deacetylase